MSRLCMCWGIKSFFGAAAVVLVNNGAFPEQPSYPSMTIHFVDDDASSDGDGASWGTAWRHLQDALAAAQAGDEIRVAQGRYTPDAGANQTAGDREASFVLVNGVMLRGGYGGITSADPDERNLGLFPTVLDGDLRADDAPYFSDLSTYADNSVSVIRAIVLDRLTILDGIRVRGGSGGAPQPNALFNAGGGLYSIASKLHMVDCRFYENWAMHGGGAAIMDSRGAIVKRCEFIWNRAYTRGGGMIVEIVQPDIPVVLSDCVFQYQNIGAVSSDMHSGGLHIAAPAEGPDPVMERCEFSANFALALSGGAGSIDDLNSSRQGSGIYRNCRFSQNWSDHVGGVSAKMLVDCVVSDNIAYFAAGGARVGTAIGCTFEHNVAGQWDGGGVWAMGGEFLNCRFINNWTYYEDGYGAGAWVHNDTRFTNCKFVGNSAFAGGGAVATRAEAKASLVNCTLIEHYGSIPGAALWGEGDLSNCIIWRNGSTPMAGTWMAQYNCIEGDWPGAGNINIDPFFVDPLGRDGISGKGDDDLRLTSRSPCIDSGNNLALPPDIFDLDENGRTNEPLPIDLLGNLRLVNAPSVPNAGNPPGVAVVIDMGAMEFVDFTLRADITGDGVVNVNDLLAVINDWGPCPAPCQPYCEADATHDCQVNVNDLLLVISNWG